MALPFNHGFTSKDVDQINGFVKAMNQVLIHVMKETEYDPAKRYIDSVAILDRITATTNELTPLMEQAKKDLLTLKRSIL